MQVPMTMTLFFFKFNPLQFSSIQINKSENEDKNVHLPRIAIQTSSSSLCLANSSSVTSRTLPPTPVRSLPLRPKRIQSINERPRFKLTLFRPIEDVGDDKEERCWELGAGNWGMMNCLFWAVLSIRAELFSSRLGLTGRERDLPHPSLNYL